MSGSNQPLSRLERLDLLDGFWEDALRGVSVEDVTEPAHQALGHRNLVWDASAMPAGGHYLPAFIHILRGLELAGEIDPDRDVLVETSTGTAGMALGWLAGRLGYRIVLFMPEDMPIHRIAAVRAQLPEGSELRPTPAGAYVGGMVRAFQAFMAEHRGEYQGRRPYPLDHSRRPPAIEGVQRMIEEVLASPILPASLDLVVGALGNGTSSNALFRAARAHSPEVRRIGVEPREAPVGFLRKYGQEAFTARFGAPARSGAHHLLGTGGWGVHFPLLDVEEVDEIVPVSAEDWRSAQVRSAAQGYAIGNSTAACQHVIGRLLRDAAAPRAVLSIRYDRPDVY